jgi:hypothetical protein
MPPTLIGLAVTVLTLLVVQNGAADYRIDSDHPRLFLSRQRLRLLQRERERRAPRWDQFEALVAGKAVMAEPGLALALYGRVANDNAAAQRAVEWALGPGANDLRQQAFVFDWCQDAMTPDQQKALAGRLAAGIASLAGAVDIPAVRTRALAAVAVSDHVADAPARALQAIVEKWWAGRVVPGIKRGDAKMFSLADTAALFELLHALRDNLKDDPRETLGDFFKELPARLLLRYYPPTYPAAENDYHIPMFEGSGEPDLNAAVRARAAEMEMVAYDNNARESQFLQGWVTQDRFMLRSPYGAVYEFLWANPYQPGLSYYHLPLWHHDKRFGELYARSAWEESAEWFGYAGGQAQAVAEGKIKQLALRPSGKPLVVGTTAILVGSGEKGEIQFELEPEPVARHFIIGLAPRRAYQVEVDDEELAEDSTDPGGILEVPATAGRRAGVRVHPAPGVAN